MALLAKGNTPPTSAQLNLLDATTKPPSKYVTTLTIPPEFPSILKEFTREVLRTQPSDIIAFGVQYFSRKQANQGGSANTAIANKTVTATANANRPSSSVSKDNQSASSRAQTPKSSGNQGSAMTEDFAATKIQATFRGYSTRKKNQYIDEDEEEEGTLDDGN